MGEFPLQSGYNGKMIFDFSKCMYTNYFYFYYSWRSVRGKLIKVGVVEKFLNPSITISKLTFISGTKENRIEHIGKSEIVLT